MMTRPITTGCLGVLGLACLWLMLPGCEGVPQTDTERSQKRQEVSSSLSHFEAASPVIKEKIKTAYGYALIPSVTKAGFGIGGANGTGEVVEKGRTIGYVEISQATIGFQAGGQDYALLVLFKDAAPLQKIKDNEFTFAAQATAIAASASASADADYEDGVLVYTLGNTGLMFEAAIGGQHLKFTPLK